MCKILRKITDALDGCLGENMEEITEERLTYYKILLEDLILQLSDKNTFKAVVLLRRVCIRLLYYREVEGFTLEELYDLRKIYQTAQYGDLGQHNIVAKSFQDSEAIQCSYDYTRDKLVAEEPFYLERDRRILSNIEHMIEKLEQKESN